VYVCNSLQYIGVSFVKFVFSGHLVGGMHYGRDDSWQRHVSRNWSYPCAVVCVETLSLLDVCPLSNSADFPAKNTNGI